MNRMIKWLVGKMVQCGACTADDTDVMCYGLDLFFSSALLIPVLLTAGCAAGHGIQLFCFWPQRFLCKALGAVITAKHTFAAIC